MDAAGSCALSFAFMVRHLFLIDFLRHHSLKHAGNHTNEPRLTLVFLFVSADSSDDAEPNRTVPRPDSERAPHSISET